MKLKIKVIVCLSLSLFLLYSYKKEIQAAEPIPVAKKSWSKVSPIKGISNFLQVSSILFRSAQPDKEGMISLKKRGIKTIINLRSFHSDRDEMADNEFNYIHLSTKTWHIEEKEIITFLKTVSDPTKQPVLVHCMQGVDRTGTMCAIYRIVIQGWEKEEAIAEMKHIGHNSVWKNLPQLIRKLDIEDIRKKAGLTKKQ
ncbi:MAG: tyrosine-protein phosphatase [Lentisphaeraceae bacterium]|nr:tyrosine-protein phosphatase [Lentisphaeraceae bacterium]